VGWLRRVLGKSDREGREPPCPDASAPARYTTEELVDILYSPSKRYREVITRDARGLFRVHDERWDTEDWDVAGAAYWCPYDRLATITDTLENARNLAMDTLSVVEPRAPEEEDVER
jgi:hypothetical protein